MGTINAVRFININYNNNAIRINDETFHFNGESTLLSLHNGGGKSVLVQMMMAPFVHAKYRGMKDRPFEGYFTSPRPSFILVEWLLDGGAGKVMTGIMVRQNQEGEEEKGDLSGSGDKYNPLEIIGIISEYSKPCLQDINNLPVVVKNKKEMTLRIFAECKHIFEEYKKNPELKFFCFDLTRYAQQTQYFARLKEYKIDYREWEDIIKKVNLKESGLSDLFADCKDERGLVEKWLLESVEKKLDPDKEKIRNFQNIVEKHMVQYKENEAKIKRRDTINQFKRLVVSDGENAQADTVRELSENYQAKIEEREQKEAGLCDLRRQIVKQSAELEGTIADNKEAISQNAQETAHLIYERYSYQSFLKEKECGEKGRERELTAMELDQKNAELQKTDQKLHILECARQNEICAQELSALNEKQAKYNVLLKKNEDLKPRLEELGEKLSEFYLWKTEEVGRSLQTAKTQILEQEQKAEAKRKVIADTEREINGCERKIGGLDSSIQAFSVREEEFNRSFGKDFSRNVLGEYEAGSLDIAMEQAKEETERLLYRGKELAKDKTAKSTLAEKLSRDKENAAEERASLLKNLENLKEKDMELDRERQELCVISQFLQLDETDALDKALLNLTLDKKIKELDAQKAELGKKLSLCEKELRAYTEGKIVELPEEMVKGLESLEINIVYGMEWLKKNRRTLKQNLETVRKCPFLPYSLIMTENELNKLATFDGELYTSLPVPVILRKDLETENKDRPGRVVDFGVLHFYVSFNEKLLDEEELKKLIVEKNREAEGLRSQIELKNSEISEYYDKKGIVNSVKFTPALYDQTKADVKKAEELLEEKEKENQKLIGQIGENTKALQECEELLSKNKDQLEKMKAYALGLEQFAKAYENYLACRKEREKTKEEVKNFRIRKDLALQGEREAKERIDELKGDVFVLEEERKAAQKKASEYDAYRKSEGAVFSQEPGIIQDQGIADPVQADQMEAEYRAISSQFTGEITELEKDIAMLSERRKKAHSDLCRLAKKYSLSEADWADKRFDENLEDSLLEKRKKQDKDAELAKAEYNNREKELAVLNQELKDILRHMKEDTGHEEALPMEQIGGKDFEARKNLLLHRKEELRKEEEALREKYNGYQGLISGLDEFKDFEYTKAFEWEQPFSELSVQKLGEIQGNLKAEYRKIREDIQRLRNRLSDRLNEIVKKEEFADEYYKKPLEAMLRLLDSPKEILEQIQITVQAYDYLMEKIAVDISMVEREREEIVSELLDYVGKVDVGLSAIDANSTIKIRDRYVKMLEISVPDGQENREIYKLRMKDFMEDLTKNVVAILNRNENPRDDIALKVNTRYLYDAVVGISNVQVKIYKIEKQRVYQISWADAAKNSGGEGFLSTFVILSSLLYYIRKDENDLFAEKNEGKVLLMDNPFAQTNAEHLLKPLMEVAKKNHTQLICLTGLGGDSIYGRFDNIYVLNLVEAKLNGGLQYLKTDHLRGAEPETLVASQVEVYDQITLF